MPTGQATNVMTHSPVGARTTFGSCAKRGQTSSWRSYGPPACRDVAWITCEFVVQASIPQLNPDTTRMMHYSKPTTARLRCTSDDGQYADGDGAIRGRTGSRSHCSTCETSPSQHPTMPGHPTSWCWPLRQPSATQRSCQQAAAPTSGSGRQSTPWRIRRCWSQDHIRHCGNNRHECCSAEGASGLVRRPRPALQKGTIRRLRQYQRSAQMGRT